MAVHMHEFDTAGQLAQALAATVADRLSAAVAQSGAASLAVSGGSTPKAFFQALSKSEIDWPQISITLVDERFVPADNPRSNHLLVAENLLQNAAASAKFIPLYREASSAQAAALIASEETRDIACPFDVVVLGMGTDGHTASFFPGGNNLAQALDAQLPRGVMTMEAEGAGEPRLTFNFSGLHDARFLVLHIEGAGKKEVLEKATGDGEETDMPIRAILRRAASPVEIFWAP